MKLLCIDSNSILNRAFYGIKLLSTKEGLYTNAVFGYMNIFQKLLDEVKPNAVACAFDLPAPTFRHKQYEGYKAQRKGMPDELAGQLPLVKELLTDLGYKIVTVEGYEADDILGTYAAACAREGDDCVIATGDRDSLQLVSEHTTVLLATTKMGRPLTTVCTPEYIKETYGVTPAQLIDVKALMGDTSDNIPGVPGIGEKGALKLITENGSLDALYQGLESSALSPKMRQKLTDGRESAYMSQDLARIRTDAPLPFTPAQCVRGEPDFAAARGLLARLQMFTMLERLGIPAQGPVQLPQQEGAPEVSKAPKEFLLNDFSALDAALEAQGPLNIVPLLENDGLTAFALDTPTRTMLFTRESPECAGALARVIASQAPKRVCDLKALCRYGEIHGIEIQNVRFDVGLAGYLLSPNSTDYTLSKLETEYGLETPLALPEDFPLERFARPCAAMNTLCDALEREVEKEGLHTVLCDIELPLAGVLASMELCGFMVDAAGIADFGRTLDGQLEELEQTIYRLAEGEFNINSPKQLGEILFDRLGLPVRRKTKSGYSTDAEVLESLMEYHPVIPSILEYRKLIKLKTTYVDGLLKVVGGDGRIHSVFRQMETRTGRISSTEPNMQNIPVRTPLGSTLRKFFVAREGCVLVDADYSQIELRVLAHIADDKNMQQAFASGEDIHTQTAAQVFDLPPLMVTPQMRSRAKAVNFGIVYGIGAFSLSKDIGVSIAEADQYIKNYLETYSGVRKYMEDTVERAKADGFVTTILGRRRALPELQSTNKNMQAFGRRVAMNTPIQGTAADIIKLAMIKVYQRLKREGMRSRLILQVHDELIVEAPLDEVDRAGMILRQEMENAVSMKVNLKVDLNVGKNWYDAK